MEQDTCSCPPGYVGNYCQYTIGDSLREYKYTLNSSLNI